MLHVHKELRISRVLGQGALSQKEEAPSKALAAAELSQKSEDLDAFEKQELACEGEVRLPALEEEASKTEPLVDARALGEADPAPGLGADDSGADVFAVQDDYMDCAFVDPTWDLGEEEKVDEKPLKMHAASSSDGDSAGLRVTKDPYHRSLQMPPTSRTGARR